MFEVLSTWISGEEYRRVESDYRLTWTTGFGHDDEVLIRTPWMHRTDLQQPPRCTCEGNPELKPDGFEVRCAVSECGKSWGLGWGEARFFRWPPVRQTEGELVRMLSELEAGGTYLIRSTTDGQQEEAECLQLAAED